MLSKAQMQEALKKHGGISPAARALGVDRMTFKRWMRGGEQRAGVRSEAATEAGKAVGKSLAEFRQQHDKSFIVPNRVRDALKRLGDGWEYEVQFAKLCGVSLSDLGNFREAFADHVVVVRRDGKRAWAGTKSVAARMREMLK